MQLAMSLSIVALMLLAPTPSVHAVKLYKWVDDNGRVTYQDRPPPSGAAEIEEKEINPDQNTVDSYVPPASSIPGSPAPTGGRATDDNDVPARLGADSRQRRRVRQGGGAGDDSSVGGVPPPGPPAPPAPPPSVPLGTGGL
jgi:hypothetical protein